MCPRAGYDVASAAGAASWSAVPSILPSRGTCSGPEHGRLGWIRSTWYPTVVSCPVHLTGTRAMCDGPALGGPGWVRIHAPTGTDRAESRHAAGVRRAWFCQRSTNSSGVTSGPMTINKPVIIVGTGRCRSTVFHRLLAKHSDVMWLSGFCDTGIRLAGSGTSARSRRRGNGAIRCFAG